MNASNRSIHCVAFDAVGTLITPFPSVAEVYQAAARQGGIELSAPEIRERFVRALRSRTLLETSEQAEYQFWQATVADVLGPVRNPEQCFQNLYEHFGRPESWRLAPQAAETITRLQQQGIDICVASNFDSRLRTVMQGIPELSGIRTVIISSEVGWRKPDPRFYQALLARLPCAAAQVLMVGDDYELDIVPAQNLGLQTRHLQTTLAASVAPVSGVISSLIEVAEFCEASQQ
jgi:putative hydrolase of the HAD superfamily